MKINLTCRDATRLVLQGEDRRLTPGERLTLRLHLLICKACPNFVRQVSFLRGAMGGWQRYADAAPSSEQPLPQPPP